jgi:hypothetical protein
MAYRFFWELEEAYNEKYGVRIESNWGGNCILQKKVGKKSVYMKSDLKDDKINDMMLTGLEIGTNYLEDSLLAAGKEWVATSRLATRIKGVRDRDLRL